MNLKYLINNTPLEYSHIVYVKSVNGIKREVNYETINMCLYATYFIFTDYIKFLYNHILPFPFMNTLDGKKRVINNKAHIING
jgi:hypothetical protein